MDYIELTLDAADAEQAEILTAELADFPFESFEQEGARLKAYIPQERLADCKGEVDALLAHYGVGRATFLSIEPCPVPRPRRHGGGGGHHAQNVVRHGPPRHDLPDGFRIA